MSESGQEHIFEFAGYVLNCAEMSISLRGSPRYSALRFLEVFRRIVDLYEHFDCIEPDSFLVELKEKLRDIPIERNNVEATRAGIQDLLILVADEAAKRV